MSDTPDNDEHGAGGRRQFLRWSLGAAGLGALCGVDGFLVEPNLLDVTRHEVEIQGLPPDLDGFTIAHLTDLHFGNVRGAHRKTLESLEREQPDLVACTGDLIETTDDIDTFVDYARRLVDLSPHIVAILGNWERRHGKDQTRKKVRAYETAGLPLLSNEHELIAENILVVGGDDPVTGHFDPAAAFDDLPQAAVRLFLLHAPGPFERTFPDSPSFDLSLAGHTHGGQIRIGPFAPVTPRGSGRFTSGFYDTPLGRLYVSRGIGMTLFRARFMCPPELPYFILRRAG